MATEIAGAIGVAALPISAGFEKSHLQRHGTLINSLLAAQRHRLAVDKLWKDRPDDDLLLEEGVSFRLRLRQITAPAT